MPGALPRLGKIAVDKLLIANRGEIACRIMTTARRLGIPTVAVFSDADRTALHVKMADEAVHIGRAPAAESYLRSDAIVEAARRTGATAVHPGYGFLSENHEFSAACAAEGLSFVGPPASAILSMGDKNTSKRIMADADVPLVPGCTPFRPPYVTVANGTGALYMDCQYHGEDQSLERLMHEAREVGFPILVKAARGGGGKGMKLAIRERDLQAALESAKREAAAAFGDDRVLIERYVQRPRHIEVQVIADAHGNVAHLYERDCSVQRRHQKVLEEAPAPGITAEFRRGICDTAIAAAHAVGYVNAGTVEFIVDADSCPTEPTYLFCEMNTRLQVEHPVSESITGIDLVEWQLRVAAGETLPALELPLIGHSIEARLYAERPDHDFVPDSGIIRRWLIPSTATAFIFSDNGMRVDSGVQQGDEVGSHYDPMIAKVITQGADRTEALARMTTALGEIEVSGLHTNLDFLQRIVAHPAFAAGELDTQFISKHRQQLFATEQLTPDFWTLAAALLHQVLVAETAAKSPHVTGPWAVLDSFRPNYQHVKSYTLTQPSSGTICASRMTFQHDRSLSVQGTIGQGSDEHANSSSFDSVSTRVRLDGDAFEAVVDGSRMRGHYSSYLAPGARVLDIWIGGRHVELRQPVVAKWAAVERSGTTKAAGRVVTPMPGRVTKVFAQDGDQVAEGDAILELTSMKLFYAVNAPCAGTLSGLSVAPGDQVSSDEVLCDVISEAVDSAAPASAA